MNMEIAYDHKSAHNLNVNNIEEYKKININDIEEENDDDDDEDDLEDKCPKCEHIFSDMWALIKHCNDAHDLMIEIDNEKGLLEMRDICEYCDETFSDLDDLEVHTIQIHKKDFIREEDKDIESSPEFSGSNSTFFNSDIKTDDNSNHQKVIDNEGENCPNCNDFFSDISALNEHFKLIHETNDPTADNIKQILKNSKKHVETEERPLDPSPTKMNWKPQIKLQKIEQIDMLKAKQVEQIDELKVQEGVDNDQDWKSLISQYLANDDPFVSLEIPAVDIEKSKYIDNEDDKVEYIEDDLSVEEMCMGIVNHVLDLVVNKCMEENVHEQSSILQNVSSILDAMDIFLEQRYSPNSKKRKFLADSIKHNISKLPRLATTANNDKTVDEAIIIDDDDDDDEKSETEHINSILHQNLITQKNAFFQHEDIIQQDVIPLEIVPLQDTISPNDLILQNDEILRQDYQFLDYEIENDSNLENDVSPLNPLDHQNEDDNWDETVDHNCTYCMQAFWFENELKLHMEKIHKTVNATKQHMVNNANKGAKGNNNAKTSKAIINNEPKEDDDDLMVTKIDYCTVDPLTKKQIANPVKNKKCSHIYERSTIIPSIDQATRKKKKMRCPYMGCNNKNVRQNDLVFDKDISEQIKKTQENLREEESSEESDDDLDNTYSDIANNYEKGKDKTSIQTPFIHQKETLSAIELDSDDEDDLIVTQIEYNTIDPLTKKQILNPVKNTICSHIYERSTIIPSIDQAMKNKKNMRCPYMGCNNKNVNKLDLVYDKNVSEQIKKSQQKPNEKQPRKENDSNEELISIDNDKFQIPNSIKLMYTCNKCSFKSTQKEKLTAHKENMHAANPQQAPRVLKYACSKCRYVSFQKEQLDKHRKQKHEAVAAPKIIQFPQVVNQKESEVDDADDYTCRRANCMQTFWFKSQLYVHMATAHK